MYDWLRQDSVSQTWVLAKRTCEEKEVNIVIPHNLSTVQIEK